MKKNLMLVVLAVAILLVVGVSSAFADTNTVTAGAFVAKTATDTVTVKATVNPKLILAVTTPAVGQVVDFGATVDPGTAVGPQAVSLAVWSNKTYNITITKAGSVALMGLSTTLADSTNNAKTSLANNAAGSPFSDSYSLNVPWNTDPAAYTATVLYTVVQN